MTTRVSNSLATLFPACLASICMVAVAYGNPNYRLLHTCNNNSYKNHYKNHNYNNYNVLLFIDKITILDYIHCNIQMATSESKVTETFHSSF